jgi:hypothetical protein
VTAPHFLDNAEAEDAAELAALAGIDLNVPASDAQLDAFASDICRHLANTKADLSRYDEAEAAEHARIAAFYESREEPLIRRIEQLEAIGEEIARRATFPGKSKSRKVAFGCYGSRRVGEKVTVVDEGKAINFLLENRPSAVAHVSKYKILLDVAKAAVKDHLTASGEVPDGFSHVGETEKFFIKPDA